MGQAESIRSYFHSSCFHFFRIFQLVLILIPHFHEMLLQSLIESDIVDLHYRHHGILRWILTIHNTRMKGSVKLLSVLCK